MQGFGTYELDEAAGGRTLSCYRPPVPLFPSLDNVWDAFHDAQRSVGEFDRALSAFPVPGVAGKLFARLDAVRSSGAGGTTTTFTDLMEFESSRRRARDIEDAVSVAGCAEAFDALQQEPLAVKAAILAIHRRLFERARDPYVWGQAGRWKCRSTWTPDPDAANGRFFYTRYQSIQEALLEWETFTLGRGGPELVRQALSHWMFEHIHPVADGNGRIGRLLVPLIVRHKGETVNACCFLGEAVHRNKDLYVDALKEGRRLGDLTHWTRVLLSFAAQTAAMNLDRLDRLRQVYHRWQSATEGARSNSAVHRLVPWVLTKPIFTIKDALAGVGRGRSFSSVNAGIGKLVDLGIVDMIGPSNRDRLFAATEVIRLFRHRRAVPDTAGA